MFPVSILNSLIWMPVNCDSVSSLIPSLLASNHAFPLILYVGALSCCSGLACSSSFLSSFLFFLDEFLSDVSSPPIFSPVFTVVFTDPFTLNSTELISICGPFGIYTVGLFVYFVAVPGDAFFALA